MDHRHTDGEMLSPVVLDDNDPILLNQGQIGPCIREIFGVSIKEWKEKVTSQDVAWIMEGFAAMLFNLTRENLVLPMEAAARDAVGGSDELARMLYPPESRERILYLIEFRRLMSEHCGHPAFSCQQFFKPDPHLFRVDFSHFVNYTRSRESSQKLIRKSLRAVDESKHELLQRRDEIERYREELEQLRCDENGEPMSKVKEEQEARVRELAAQCDKVLREEAECRSCSEALKAKVKDLEDVSQHKGKRIQKLQKCSEQTPAMLEANRKRVRDQIDACQARIDETKARNCKLDTTARSLNTAKLDLDNCMSIVGKLRNVEADRDTASKTHRLQRAQLDKSLAVLEDCKAERKRLQKHLHRLHADQNDLENRNAEFEAGTKNRMDELQAEQNRLQEDIEKAREMREKLRADIQEFNHKASLPCTHSSSSIAVYPQIP